PGKRRTRSRFPDLGLFARSRHARGLRPSRRVKRLRSGCRPSTRHGQHRGNDGTTIARRLSRALSGSWISLYSACVKGGGRLLSERSFIVDDADRAAARDGFPDPHVALAAGAQPPRGDLKSALRRARVENAERFDVISELRGAEVVRLEMLQEQLAPVLAQVPTDCDLIDLLGIAMLFALLAAAAWYVYKLQVPG